MKVALGLRHHPLLLGSALAGLAVGLAAWLLGVAPPRAVLLGWCAAAVLWLVLVLRGMLGASPAFLRRRAAQLDEGKWAMLAATLAAAVAAILAVVWDMAAATRPAPLPAVLLDLAAVFLAWAFLHVLFATHYAHAYWLAGGGVEFPGNDKPDFGEFLYFAFTIGMTFQVSDATTSSRAMRQLALLHGVVAFFFNAVILAAAVSVAAGLAA